jgi:cell wall-associated NlpC family hydrolase
MKSNFNNLHEHSAMLRKTIQKRRQSENDRSMSNKKGMLFALVLLWGLGIGLAVPLRASAFLWIQRADGNTASFNPDALVQQQDTIKAERPDTTAIVSASQSGNVSYAQSVVDYAMRFLGVRYKRGASGPKQFDCSGYTSYIFRKFGYTLSHTAPGQATQCIKINDKDLRVGDLVFFDHRRARNHIGHVAIVTKVYGEGDFDFIHATVKKHVTIDNSKSAYYQKRYMSAGRILNNDSASVENSN